MVWGLRCVHHLADKRPCCHWRWRENAWRCYRPFRQGRESVGRRTDRVVTTHYTASCHNNITAYDTFQDSVDHTNTTLGPLSPLWFMLNRFRTGRARFAANLWAHYIVGQKGLYDQLQMTNHIMKSCPLTKLAVDVLLQLRSVNYNYRL